MSQSCRARLFFGARLVWQNSSFYFIYFLLIFFSIFLWTCLSKYRWKDMTDTIKHFEQQTSSTLRSVLYLVHPKIKFHIFKLNKVVTDSNLKHLLLGGEKKNIKKNVFRSGFPICHKLWDIFFFSLALWRHVHSQRRIGLWVYLMP